MAPSIVSSFHFVFAEVPHDRFAVNEKKQTGVTSFSDQELNDKIVEVLVSMSQKEILSVTPRILKTSLEKRQWYPITRTD